MPGGIGALQTRGTCWFYSIINGFLLSDSGQKIMFDALGKFYETLTDKEKAQFEDGVPPPCVNDLMKAKKLHFYKFLDQFLSFRSGPRSVNAKTGKSANILNGIRLANANGLSGKGGKGGYPGLELPVILNHLGFGRSDYRIVEPSPSSPSIRASLPVGDMAPHFVVCKLPGTAVMNVLPTFRPETYSPMCCSIVIGNPSANNNQDDRFHSITGFTCNNKGFLFDSNQRRTFTCSWWNVEDVKRVVRDELSRHYLFFRNGQVSMFKYSFVIFSNNSFVKSIAPFSKLKYKNTITPDIMNHHYSDPTFNNLLNQGALGRFTPAEQIALKRAQIRYLAKHPALNKVFFNSVLGKAKNMDAAMIMVYEKTMQGFRKDYVHFPKFIKNLKAKFAKKPEPNQDFINNAKRQMSAQTSKAARGRIYSEIWQKLPPKERDRFRNFRNTGLWVTRSSNNNVNLFLKTKQRMSVEMTKAARGKIYSEVWKKLPVHERIVLKEFSLTGKWVGLWNTVHKVKL